MCIRDRGYAKDYEYQSAPVINAGSTAAKAGSVQLLIGSDWESGDKITLQVQSDAAGFGAGSQVACLSAAQSISFAGPYVLADTSVAGPYQQYPWSELDPATDPDQNSCASDVRVPDITTPSVAPTFNVALTTSPSCLGVGVTDQIEITFSNTGNAGISGDRFEITFNNIRYNVGAGVNPGPVHVIPFAREAVDAAPGTYLSKPIFGGNVYSPVLVNMWTNNAYIAPVRISAAPTNIVGDGAYQPLGNITLTELAPDALHNGYHLVCLSTVSNILNPLSLTVTGNTGGSGTATALFGNCIEILLADMVLNTAGTVVISGIVANANISGPIGAELISWGGGVWPGYLVPDDQTAGAFGGNSSQFSDVDYGANPSTGIGVSFAVPNRIGGNDRYETSAKIAANVEACTEWAVVVSGSSLSLIHI